MKLGCISLFMALVSGTAASSGTFLGLRSHTNDHDETMQTSNTRGHASMKRDHMHFIHRIYGPENQKVREEVRKLEVGETEGSPEYLRTGIRGDPTFQIKYKNHPLAPDIFDETSNRNLQQNSTETESLFRPIRITFDLTALESEKSGDPTSATDRAVELIKSSVLPKMKEFWSNALKVVPVEGALQIQRAELSGSGKYCGDTEFSQVPDSHVSDGVSDTDLILYVSGRDSTRFCGTNTLAVAIACNWDQYDRPTAGAINFCLNTVETTSEGESPHPSIEESNVAVAIHEAAHVLGMSSNSYRYFWDPETSQPRTPRPFKASSVQCVDGETRTIYLPDENTLRFGESKLGKRYAMIVTPKVKTVARNQFNCQELEGAQLENQPTGSSCTGDHWDERMFYPESLSGVISPTTIILSPLTLALMEDSGWYSANYTFASVSPWGHGVGCDFVNEACLVKENGQTVVPDYGRGFFCTKSSQRGCSPSHHFKMACTLKDYDVYVSQPNPPTNFQYFAPENPGYGGLVQADYCPLFGSIYRSDAYELDCRLSENQNIIFDQWYEKFGPDSMCLESSSNTGRCYQTFCDLGNFQFGFFVGTEKYVCEEDFQQIEITDVTGFLTSTITCPRLSQVCPDMFCPANCAGRGVCNFESAIDVNGTLDVRPRCECFDKNDTSLACSESLVLDGKYIANGDGLGSSENSNFFDALKRVFTDDPNTWTTASWIWASAIFVFFLLLVLCVFSTLCCSRNRKLDKQRPLAYTEPDYHYSSQSRGNGYYHDSQYGARPPSRGLRY
jgi:hypothetical protein